MGRRHHFERVIVAAIALAVQTALYLLLAESDLHLSRTKSQPAFTVTMLNATRPRRVRAVHRARKIGARKPVIEPLVVQPIELPKLQMHPSEPAVDWQAAISREVGAEVSGAPQPTLRFGFPRMPAKRDLPPAFSGWDEVRTHRARRLANGIIDLGHCVITLSFPIPICNFGKSPANGKLFEHMHDDRTAVGSLP